ncbi:MAG: hypothetical protein A2X78_01500 [Gammaproteobacteria bacterium GWE2_37_16]|nr:MAG: hypothetical protein A2X78_01500 [Gammaproteobacteria bacterium GWE2_37_16]
MKRLLIYFLFLLAAVWLGIKLQTDSGYVLVTYHNWSLETTFWFALLSLVFCFALFYLFLRFVYNSKILPKRVQYWWHKHKEKKAIRLTNDGLLNLVEENWASAEKKLIHSARHSPNPFISYLTASQAAQNLSAHKRRDTYLNKAHSCIKKSEFAISLYQVKMQIQSHQLEQALCNLKQLHILKPKHPLIIKLLKEVYLSLHDWDNLRSLLPLLDNRKVLSKQDFLNLEQLVYLQLIQESVQKGTFTETRALWSMLPRYLQNTPDIAYCYVLYLLQNDSHLEAEQILKNALIKKWHPSLLSLYSATNSTNPTRQLALAEKWIDTHPEDKDLLLCLGNLCKKNSLWGKSRTYLEKYISLDQNNPLIYFELGSLMEIYEDTPKALYYFHKGLEIASNNSDYQLSKEMTK